jgi:LuxR family maltose regulon positive regulatory protein
MRRLEHPGRVVLVAAPAGFGKTSVLVEWLASSPATHVAWLSLDERDDDAATFWTYLLAALDTAVPGVASDARAALPTEPIEAVLTSVVNALLADGSDAVLVLDDLHVITQPAIHAGLVFLVDNLPANAHLVIASRSDPPWPLARLRARGDLTELRAADLRFTAEEAATYLNDVMGLAVPAADVERLDDRTEGWIAALQLAALSLQGRADTGSFIAGFAGDDRYIVDYLVEEVLRRLPEATRRFLLDTAILERLTGALCDTVTGTSGGAAMLDSLERSNLFLVPLDDQREWYRYHHLFAEMLAARLRDEHPERVAGLHLRASEWFEARGSTAEAIGHAIDAGAYERAGRLILAAMPGMQAQRQEVTLVGWFESLPPETFRAGPALAVGFAGCLLSAGRTDRVEELLADAEAAGGTSDGVTAIRRGVSLYRAAQAMTAGDLETAMRESAVALELAAEGSHLDRGSAHGLRGLVLWAVGDLEQARATWAVSLDELRRAGHLADTLGGSIAMGDILIALGRLDEAEEVFRRGLATGSADPANPMRGTADMHVGLADLLRERDDLTGARAQLAAASALGEYAGLPQNRHRRRMAQARLLQAEGRAGEGLPLLDEAQDLYTPDFFPEVRPIAAVRARLLLAAGRTPETAEWVRAHRVGVDDDLSYLTEFDHITLVRILIADPADPSNAEDALRLIGRLRAAAESGARTGAVIELGMLQALALQRLGRSDEAVGALADAVAGAQPAGYVRLFADEGERMAHLLTAVARRGGDTPCLRRLIDAAAAGAGPAAAPPQGSLPDPLSERELEVLRLLATDLSGPDIARHLVVSLNTLRTHTKNIFTKLGVGSRREAVTRAGDLGLLNSPR